MNQTTPQTLASGLRDAYLRYFDTAFWLNDESVMAERRELLEKPGVLLGKVMIEPVIPYANTELLSDVAARADIPVKAAERVASALFPGIASDSLRLRQHQAQSVLHHFKPGSAPGRNVVVTSGTGSGKTESFLLPLLLRLTQESSSWPVQSLPTPWWRSAIPQWKPLRGNETRLPGIRGLILYPTNALVEDQMTRLRRAVRTLRDDDTDHPIWFGRYTGNTIGSGKATKQAAGEVGEELRAHEREYDALAAAQRAGRSDVDLSQFPDPRSGEMMTRWDMVRHAPDILVTNYSMLNTMMMRHYEREMFEQTATWLNDDDENVFTLVVDELHLYRGTQGSEVAMILRALLRRLGLPPDSPQLRIIATSASLTDSDDGRLYLTEFFGLDTDSFTIEPGQQIPLISSQRLTPDQVRDRVVDPTLLTHAIATACIDDTENRVRATALNEIAQRLFPDTDDADSLMADIFQQLGDSDSGVGTPPSIPLRAHVFVRVPRGMWACSNPECAGVCDPARRTRIGRLYTTPIGACVDCGARVLELLYCYECGDASLGGYIIEGSRDEKWLSPSPVTEEQSAKPVFLRPAKEYFWYRPGLLDVEVPTWTKDGVKLAFSPVTWNPDLGMMTTGPLPTGMRLVVSSPDDHVPALPDRCPACSYVPAGRSKKGAYRAGQVSSAIRAHNSGPAAASQLYLSQLIRELAQDDPVPPAVANAKTIVFTDSRDDAARTAAGVARNHHRDLVRQVLRRELASGPDAETALDALLANPGELKTRPNLLAGVTARLKQYSGNPLAPEDQAALDDALGTLRATTAVGFAEMCKRIAGSSSVSVPTQVAPIRGTSNWKTRRTAIHPGTGPFLRRCRDYGMSRH